MNTLTGKPELKRALFHIVSTIAMGFVAAKVLGVMALCVAFAFVAYVECKRKGHASLQQFVIEEFGDYMSDEEKADPPKLSGILPMLGALIVALTFLSQSQFGLMILIMALGDPAARIAGVWFSNKYGVEKYRLPWAKNKSMAGFAAIWIVGAILTALWGFTWSSVVVISFACALAESIGSRKTWYSDDNMLMPCAAIGAIKFSMLFV